MNTTILDTHLHLYPNYDLPRAFNRLIDRSAHLGTTVSRVACLAERHDCQYFQELSAGEVTLAGFNIETLKDNELKLTRISDHLDITLLPGRQIITRENIEVLALACPEMIDDKQPALDVIFQINQLKRVPVIAWSPGKWFTRRGKLVERLINELNAADFLIGDTTLRPYGWGLPRLMKLAQQQGYNIVAGSDPLPFNGEEDWLGAYYTVAKTEANYSATELLHAIKRCDSQVECHTAGKRTNIFNLFQRLRKNAASKK